MIAVHIEAARRVRRQPGIVVRLLDQVFRASSLVKTRRLGGWVR
jgi:hypothetical protein